MEFEVPYITCLLIPVSVKTSLNMATAKTNQLPNVSFIVTAGTAKSLKITSDSRSNFDLVFFSRAQRHMQHAVVLGAVVDMCTRTKACLVALRNCTHMACLQITPHHVQRRFRGLA